MLSVPADLTIRCRWMAPMTAPGELLENHTLVVGAGRILEVLPNAQAARRHAGVRLLARDRHLVLPGLVNAFVRIVPPPGCAPDPAQLEDGALLCLGEMLKGGTTAFASLGVYPDEAARLAVAHGMRALIGIPLAETPSRWAGSPPDYLTQALRYRDEYRSHPLIATAFAPLAACTMSDATLGRIATLAAELDASVVLALHESAAEISRCVQRHGLRPIARLEALGLLTPALTAASMARVEPADIEAAARCGVAVALCPEASLRSGVGLPPVAAFAAAGLRLGLGSGMDESVGALDLWGAIRLLALHSRDPWEALAAATRGGAACLGLEDCTGTLQAGKWADLCCIDLGGTALQRAALQGSGDPLAWAVYNGGRDTVSDVWVAGRHLLEGGMPTRLTGE